MARANEIATLPFTNSMLFLVAIAVMMARKGIEAFVMGTKFGGLTGAAP